MSRRIGDEAERERLRRILEGFGGDGGFIARTAAAGATAAELAADRRYLIGTGGPDRRKSENASAPPLLQRELDLALRVVRDLVGAGLRGHPRG